MIDKHLDVAAQAGAMRTFVCHPERNGPHPLLLFFMDAPGIREELRGMARRLATVGYYVMLPNLYYRFGVEELGPFMGDAGAAVREKMMGYADALSIAQVMEDARALFDAADADPAALGRRAGSVGYCMSGRFALATATTFPDRIAAAASLYGTRLVTDRADSPHLTVSRARAELYLAFAEVDQYVPLDTASILQQSVGAGSARAEVEIYRGVHHGFAFPERPMYDRDAAERHWERLFSMFARNLGAGSS